MTKVTENLRDFSRNYSFEELKTAFINVENRLSGSSQNSKVVEEREKIICALYLKSGSARVVSNFILEAVGDNKSKRGYRKTSIYNILKKNNVIGKSRNCDDDFDRRSWVPVERVDCETSTLTKELDLRSLYSAHKSCEKIFEELGGETSSPLTLREICEKIAPLGREWVESIVKNGF